MNILYRCIECEEELDVNVDLLDGWFHPRCCPLCQEPLDDIRVLNEAHDQQYAEKEDNKREEQKNRELEGSSDP